MSITELKLELENCGFGSKNIFSAVTVDLNGLTLSINTQLFENVLKKEKQ